MAKRFKRGKALEPHIVRLLTMEVIETFKKEYKQKKGKDYEYTNDAVLFGYGAYDDDEYKDTIKAYLCNNDNVKQVVADYVRKSDLEKNKKDPDKVIEGNYLWKKNFIAQGNNNEPIPFKDHYRDIFLAYIGKDLTNIEDAYKDSYSYYIGYYLSFSEFLIKSLLLRVTNSVNVENRHEITLEGIHSRSDAENVDTYDGTLWHEDGWLYGEATGRSKNRRISLIGAVNNQTKLINNPIIRTFIHGITFDATRLFSWEVVFHKIDRTKLEEMEPAWRKLDQVGPVDPKIVGELFAPTSLYLTLHRNTVSFRSELVQNMRDVTNKNIPISNIAHIIGTYRLINIDFEYKNVVISSFSVLDGKIGSLRTWVPSRDKGNPLVNPEWTDPITDRLQDQNSMIDISSANNQPNIYKVVAHTFINKFDIVNVAMFDFPTITEYKEGQVITGTFSTLSDQRHGNVSAYFAMKKVSDKRITPGSMPLEKALDDAIKFDYLDLLETLLQLNIENCLKPARERGNNIEGLLKLVKENKKPKLSKNMDDSPEGIE